MASNVGRLVEHCSQPNVQDEVCLGLREIAVLSAGISVGSVNVEDCCRWWIYRFMLQGFSIQPHSERMQASKVPVNLDN